MLPTARRPVSASTRLATSGCLLMLAVATAPASSARNDASPLQGSPVTGLTIAGQLGGIFRSVVAGESRAFAAVGPTVRTYANEPSGASFLGNLALPLQRYTLLAATDEWLYLGTGAEVWSVDVSDPAGASVAGNVALPAPALSAVLIGTDLLVAYGPAGTAVVDVVNPAQPQVSGTLPGAVVVAARPGGAVAAADGRLILLEHDGSTWVPGPEVETILEPLAIAADGGTIALAGLPEFESARVEFRDSGTGELRGAHDLNRDPGAVALAGGIAYVGVTSRDRDAFGAGPARLDILDITIPSSPAVIGSAALPDDITGLALIDDRAFIAVLQSGLHVMDVADAGLPVQIYRDASLGSVHAMAQAGGVTYVAASTTYVFVESDTLWAVDTDGAEPSILGSTRLDTTGLVGGLVATDNFLVMTAGEELIVFDPGPNGATELGRLALGDFAAGVAARGDTAFVANKGRVAIVSLADPANPEVVGSYPVVNGVAVATAVEGDLMAVAIATSLQAGSVGDDYIELVDVSDPASPVELASAGLEGVRAWDHALTLLADRLYVGALWTFDFEAPDQLVAGWSDPDPRPGSSLAVSDGLVMAATEHGALRAYYAEASEEPVSLTVPELSGSVEAVVIGAVPLVATYSDGLFILATSASGPTPTPVTPETPTATTTPDSPEPSVTPSPTQDGAEPTSTPGPRVGVVFIPLAEKR